jgi:hypothetical protein
VSKEAYQTYQELASQVLPPFASRSRRMSHEEEDTCHEEEDT